MAEKWRLVDIEENDSGVIWGRDSKESIPNGLFHLAVDIWIKDDEGNFLMTQRHPDKSWGLKWECSGGAVLADESALEGARRELLEETGINLAEKDFCYLGKTTLPEYHCIMHSYVVYVDADIELKLQPEEVVDSKWVTGEELVQMKENIVDTVWDRYLQFETELRRGL